MDIKLIVESTIDGPSVSDVVRKHFEVHKEMMPNRSDYSWHDDNGVKSYGHPTTHAELENDTAYKKMTDSDHGHIVGNGQLTRLYSPDRVIEKGDNGSSITHHLDHPAQTITYKMHQTITHPVTGHVLHSAEYGPTVTVKRNAGEAADDFANRAHKEHERVHGEMGIHSGLLEDAAFDQRHTPELIEKPTQYAYSDAAHNMIHSGEVLWEADHNEPMTIGQHFTHMTDGRGEIHKELPSIQHHSSMTWHRR